MLATSLFISTIIEVFPFAFCPNIAGSEAGASPGYGLTLVAETTTGCSISSEIMGEKGQLPEDVAKQCVQTLFNEILRVRAMIVLAKRVREVV